MGTPVSESTMASANTTYSSLANKNISIEQMNTGANAQLNVGAVEIGTTQSGLAPNIPEVGKGSLVDLKI